MANYVMDKNGEKKQNRRLNMSKSILNWEAVSQIEEALIDGISDEQLQDVLDIIYGKNMFTMISSEMLRKRLFEDKEIITVLNKHRIE